MVLFTINSEDRDNPARESTTDFTVTCERLAGVKEVNRDGAQITVRSVAVPIMYNNIRANNNVVVYTASAGSGPRTVTLTQGYYTVSQFASHLASVITADMVADIGAGNSLAVTYSSISMRYTYTPTLTAGTFTFNPVSQPGYTAHFPTGFRTYESADPTAVATTVGIVGTFAALLGYSELYVWCDIPGVNSYSGARKAWGQLLAVLHPIGCAEQGQVMQWQAQWHDGFRIPSLWTRVRYQLRDHNDNIIELNGAPINITLNITGIKDGLPKDGYVRPSVELEELFKTSAGKWFNAPFLPSLHDNRSRPAGDNGVVIDAGFMSGGQLDRQQALRRKFPFGEDKDSKRNRR